MAWIIRITQSGRLIRYVSEGTELRFDIDAAFKFTQQEAAQMVAYLFLDRGYLAVKVELVEVKDD